MLTKGLPSSPFTVRGDLEYTALDFPATQKFSRKRRKSIRGRLPSPAPHAPVHRIIRQAVRVLVLMPQRVDDLEPLQPRNFLLRLLVQGPQARALHFVLPRSEERRVGKECR